MTSSFFASPLRSTVSVTFSPGRWARIATIRLGLSVTAEGVETPSQLSELRTLGCDLGQGYYFAHPQPGAIVRALVHHRFHWRQRDPAA